MKKLILAMAAIALAGCYKDKGNYDYSPAAQVRITMPLPGTSVVGEELTIVPTIESTASDFDYCWANTGISESSNLFGDAAKWDTIAMTKDLHWVPNRLGRNILRLYVREKSSGVITQAPIVVTVSTLFDRGWVVLSDVGGKSVISFVKPTSEQVDNVKTRKFVPYPDLWATLFPGQALGTQPQHLAMQYGPASAGGSLVYVFQGDKPQVLSGNTFGVERPFDQMMAAAPPAGFAPGEIVTLNANPGFSILRSTDGKLYTRHMTDPNVGFYSFLYSSVPMSLEGNDVVADYLPNMNMMVSPGQLLADRTSRRVLFFVKNTGRNGMGQTGRVAKIIYTGAAPEFDYSGWAPDVELLHLYAGQPTNFSMVTYTTDITHTAIYRKAGTVKWQIGMGPNTVAPPFGTYKLGSFTNGDFPADVAVDGTTVFRNMPSGGGVVDPLMFIATGNKIWWFDVRSKQFQEFYTLPAGDQVVEMMENPQQSELAVITKGGRFVMLDIVRANIMAGQKIWETQLPGTVVDLDYKYNFLNFGMPQPGTDF